MSMDLRRTSAAFLFLLVAFTASSAGADLYKYRTSSGEIIITSEKRSDLKLIEVVSSSGKPKKKKRKRTRRRPKPKRSESTTVGGKRLNTQPHPENDVPRAERHSAFDDIIREASQAYDVPFSFVKAVVRVESNFNSNATSQAGAMGLMQLMPKTAASLNVTDPYDPRQNIFGGTRFLRILIDRYDGDINLILAAYNAGDVAVARYDGIPYPKTRGYVASVYQWYQQYSAADGQ